MISVLALIIGCNLHGALAGLGQVLIVIGWIGVAILVGWGIIIIWVLNLANLSLASSKN
jgi:hypothetical protein